MICRIFLVLYRNLLYLCVLLKNKKMTNEKYQQHLISEIGRLEADLIELGPNTFDYYLVSQKLFPLKIKLIKISKTIKKKSTSKFTTFGTSDVSIHLESLIRDNGKKNEMKRLSALVSEVNVDAKLLKDLPAKYFEIIWKSYVDRLNNYPFSSEAITSRVKCLVKSILKNKQK